MWPLDGNTTLGQHMKLVFQNKSTYICSVDADNSGSRDSHISKFNILLIDYRDNFGVKIMVDKGNAQWIISPQSPEVVCHQ